MKKYLRFLLPIAGILLTVFLLFFFRVRPQYSLWSGYRVLAVGVAYPEKTVLDLLREAGVADVISTSAVAGPLFSPQTLSGLYSINLAVSGGGTTGSSYFKRIESYFFDRTKTHRLYYLKDSPPLLEKAETVLTEAGIPWGIDEQYRLPLVPPFFGLCLSLVLVFFSRKRLFFTVLQAPFVLLSFFVPFAGICLASCFSAFLFFLAQRVWGRAHFLRSLRKTPLFFVLLCSLLMAVIMSGIQAFLLFLCTCMCSISAFLLYGFVQQTLQKKLLFSPTLIRPAAARDFYVPQVFRLFLTTVSAGICIIAFFILFAGFMPSSGISGLSIPAPSRFAKMGGFDIQSFSDARQLSAPAQGLPDLADYIVFCWNAAIFPHTRLSAPLAEPELGTQVLFPSYSAEANGMIRQTDEVVYQFNSTFIHQVLDGLEKNGEFTIENLLKKQGRFFSVAYEQPGSMPYKPIFGSLPILLIGVLFVLILAGIFIYRAGVWFK